MASLQGKFLIAGSRLLDPNFRHTVVLMVQHDEQGALGLIVNRPLEVTVSQACEEILGKPGEVEGVIHQGGPCEGPLMAVHDQDEQGEISVCPGVFFTTDRSKLEELLDNGEGQCRFFVGYAGWSPGQLEEEMESGSWLVAPASESDVFGDGDRQWSRMMLQAALGVQLNPKAVPEDPSVN